MDKDETVYKYFVMRGDSGDIIQLVSIEDAMVVAERLSKEMPGDKVLVFKIPKTKRQWRWILQHCSGQYEYYTKAIKGAKPEAIIMAPKSLTK